MFLPDFTRGVGDPGGLPQIEQNISLCGVVCEQALQGLGGRQPN